MATTLDITREELEILYARLANEYCRSLHLEHFMESTDQAKQREITLESLALVTAQWPEFQVDERKGLTTVLLAEWIWCVLS